MEMNKTMSEKEEELILAVRGLTEEDRETLLEFVLLKVSCLIERLDTQREQSAQRLEF